MTLLGFIITTVGIAIVAIVLLWCLSPEFRRRIEEPKYRFRARQQFMDGERRDGYARDPKRKKR